MSRRLRLDAELVRRGEARSRDHAAELVAAGRVKVAGVRAHKPSTAVTTDVAIQVVAPANGVPEYVSRGAHKLAGALAEFGPRGLRVEGRRCLDAGASTGGFTQVLLRAGAREVVALDVGYGQLAWSVRSDDRVRVLDRTNIRDATPEQVGGLVDVAVADLSFISLRVVLGALLGLVSKDADVALMVKPQFEVGRQRVGKGGVVREAGLRADAVTGVAEDAALCGWGARGVVTSPLPGPAGNLEYFLWLRRGAPTVGTEQITAEVHRTADQPRSAARDPEGPVR